MISVKIFVSHRIDKKSKTFDNDLFVPVRCGAIYDNSETPHIPLGDNTGDNISDKRLSFCEYTVMYWAWKNQEADYYGLSHYRRFLSFTDKKYINPMLCQGFYDSMSDFTLKKLGFFDTEQIKKTILEFDAIVPYEYSLEDLKLHKTRKNIKDSWLKDHYSFLKEKHFEKLEELIEKLAPEYLNSAKEYIQGDKFIGFNIFVMKKDLFNRMCEFIFPILFEFEKEIVTDNYSSTSKRAVGYFGEWLFSIFVDHIKKENKYKIDHRHIICFQNTDIQEPITPQENAIPIVIPLDDFNRPIASVLIQSIIDNTNIHKKYDIVLLSRSYDSNLYSNFVRQSADKKLLSMCKDKENISIRLFDPREEILDIEYREFEECNNEEAYYSILLPWILKNYKKVCCITPGIICNADISEIFNEDLNENILGAVKDAIFSARLNGYKKFILDNSNLKDIIKEPYDYIKSDLFVINLEKARNCFSEEDIVSKILNLNKAPQDLFNIIYEGKVKFLHQKWNKIQRSTPESWIIDEYIPENISKELSCPNVNLINLELYNGFPPVQTSQAGEFLKYARKTPFYEEILARLIDFRISQQLSSIQNFHDINIFASNMFFYKIKKIYYKIKKSLVSQKKREKYNMKYKKIKQLLKDAKKMRNNVLKV